MVAALVGGLLIAAAAVAVVVVTGGDEPDPEQAVQDYDRVFKEADCEGFTDVTTSSFRDELGLTSCAKFDTNAQDGSISSFTLTVQSSTIDGDTSSVRTRETFTSGTGERSINLVYTLVKDDGDWKVDKIARDNGV